MSEPNPIQHFQKWFCEVRDHFPQVEVNAMAISTVGVDGFPKTRMVLLKQYTWEGFIFYTQYTSAKGKGIAAHPKVCLSFPWEKANKRITIIGVAEKISEAQSKAYFETRPRGSQLSAWASKQSEAIGSRGELEEYFDNYENHFKGISVHKPERWGGYMVRPVEIIFEEHSKSAIKCTKYVLVDNIDWEQTTYFVPQLH